MLERELARELLRFLNLRVVSFVPDVLRSFFCLGGSLVRTPEKFPILQSCISDSMQNTRANVLVNLTNNSGGYLVTDYHSSSRSIYIGLSRFMLRR